MVSIVSRVSSLDLLIFSLAAAFALIGTVQLAHPRFVRAAYERWGYSGRVRATTALLDFAAAAMLLTPALRGWGIGLGATLAFGSAVVLLNHRHYLGAAAAAALMAALVPAALAVPREAPVRFIAQERGVETPAREPAPAPAATFVGAGS